MSYSVSESSPATCEAERNTDDKPNTKDHEHCSERHCTARCLGPQEEVEKEEGSEDNSRYHDGRQGNVLLPLLAAERFVDARGDVATNEAKDGV